MNHMPLGVAARYQTMNGIKLLPGAMTAIAAELGVSKQYVSMVLAGQRMNTEVWEAAHRHMRLYLFEMRRRELVKLPKPELVALIMNLEHDGSS